MDCSLTRPKNPRAAATSLAWAMFQPAKLDEPTYRILPWATRTSMACQISSHEVSRSMWCIWYTSM